MVANGGTRMGMTTATTNEDELRQTNPNPKSNLPLPYPNIAALHRHVGTIPFCAPDNPKRSIPRGTGPVVQGRTFEGRSNSVLLLLRWSQRRGPTSPRTA